MAMNAAEGHTMLQTSQQHPNLVAQIVPSPFTFRADWTIKDLMADGYLGNLYSLVVRGATSEFANLDALIHWRQQKHLSGYNSLNMGIWYEGSMRWVGHATRVFAQTRIAVPKRRDPETGAMVDVDVPDHVDIITELPGGAQGSYQFSSVSGLGQGPGAWLFGSKGTLRFDQGSNKLFGGKPGDKELHEITIPPEKPASGVSRRNRQRHPGDGEDHPYQFRGRREVYGVHRGRAPQRRIRPGRIAATD
jgi:predicted dehydrogenase